MGVEEVETLYRALTILELALCLHLVKKKKKKTEKRKK